MKIIDQDTQQTVQSFDSLTEAEEACQKMNQQCKDSGGSSTQYTVIEEEPAGIDYGRLEEVGGFYGIDADLEISLQEYDFILRPDPDRERGCYQVIHKIAGSDKYDISYLREDDFTDRWIQEEAGFFDFVGLSREEWNDAPVHHKLSDVAGYYGMENILGTSYNPIDEDQLISWINSYI